MAILSVMIIIIRKSLTFGRSIEGIADTPLSYAIVIGIGIFLSGVLFSSRAKRMLQTRGTTMGGGGISGTLKPPDPLFCRPGSTSLATQQYQR